MKLILGLLISYSAFAAQMIPVVEHINYQDESTIEEKCHNLGGIEIISSVVYREARAGICVVGDKNEIEGVYVAVANQFLRNIYQEYKNESIHAKCENLGGELLEYRASVDKITGGICKLR
ncbi:MAG: hypothetical protein KC478_12340 [Bacteriovoracaceae bacterium]|nr:hypothetical protein [Bacteriovoracaceae bacterium]